jgi:hypothetical protein
MVDRQPDREWELVVRVRLPEGMTPERFLFDTSIEWAPERNHVAAGNFRTGPDLDQIPQFTSAKQLRQVSA